MVWPLDPTHGLSMYVRTEYVLARCSMLQSPELDMLQNYFQKKKCFDPIPQQELSVVLGHNMCLHDTLCSILINLICNMTTLRKKYFDFFYPTPGVEGRCNDRISDCMVLYVLRGSSNKFWQWSHIYWNQNYNTHCMWPWVLSIHVWNMEFLSQPDLMVYKRSR